MHYTLISIDAEIVTCRGFGANGQGPEPAREGEVNPVVRIVSFTQMKGRPVLDAEDKQVGKLKDLAILALGAFPSVTKLVVAKPNKEELYVPWEVVARLPGEGWATITLARAERELPVARFRADEMLLGKELLNKKVVDTKRRKVVRVNDLELMEEKGRLQLYAVEAGLRGILRHLGSERFWEQLARLLHLKLPREMVSWEFVEPIETELTKARRTAVYTKLAQLHPADIADIVEELNPGERAAVLEALDERTAAEALTEVEPEVQASVIQMMENERASEMLEQMEPDEAADILSDLPEAKAQELLETMERKEAREVAELLAHREDTAGGLMTPEYVAFPQSLTVAQAVEHIRAEAKEAETIYYIYVTGEGDRLYGVLSLRELILADPEKRLEDVMVRDVITVRPETKLKEIAELLTKYNLLALPVVDEVGALEGIVTVDDVLNLIVPMIWKKRAVKKYI